MQQLAIVILAAGASSRMGAQDKLMKDACGTPLLARVMGQATATQLPVFVTVPALDHPRALMAGKSDVKLVEVPDWASGMAASIRTGMTALPHHIGGAMILPGDMPDLTTDDLNNLLQTFQNKPKFIVRATSNDGIPGHPVIFPARLFADLKKITGDQGARKVIAANTDRLHLIALPGNNAICDLDTPDDWAAWTAGQDI